MELDAPTGKHDGEVKGRRYFQTKALHGCFLQVIHCRRHKPPVSSVENNIDDNTPTLAKTAAPGNTQSIIHGESTQQEQLVEMIPEEMTQRGKQQKSSETHAMFSSKVSALELVSDVGNTTLAKEEAFGTTFFEPRLVARFSYGVAVQIACGARFIAVLSKSGQIYTWGDNGP